LHLGDWIDAFDASSKVYREARVVGVDANGVVRIHFIGMDKPDAVVQRDSLEPLYTNTKNWRARLDEDDKVDVRLPSAAGTTAEFVWASGLVLELDPLSHRVKVEFEISVSKNDIDTRIADETKIVGLETNGAIVETPTDAAWFDLDGEDIAMVMKIDEQAGKDQMPGGGDGEELRQALKHPETQG
jgi:hypothetical protein